MNKKSYFLVLFLILLVLNTISIYAAKCEIYYLREKKNQRLVDRLSAAVQKLRM